jgi:hypothetical protein
MSLESSLSLWYQLGTFFGISAIVGVIISTLFNYFITLKEFGKKGHLEISQQRLSLYSYFVFQIEILRYYQHDLSKYDEDRAELLKRTGKKYDVLELKSKETFEALDLTLKDKLYLLSPDSAKDWLEIKKSYPEASMELEKKMTELRNNLRSELNTRIIPQYQNIIKKGTKYLDLDVFKWLR